MTVSKRIKGFYDRHRDGCIAAAIFILSLFFVFLFARINFDNHHTGVMFHTAVEVAEGKILFRETFTQYGALTVYLQALSVLILGRRVTSILWCTALFYAAAYALFYLICRRFVGRPLSIGMAIVAPLISPYIFWDFHPWASVFSLFFLLLTAEMVLRCEQGSTRLYPALAGLSAALAFWCRQPVGLVCILALLLIFSFFAIVDRKAVPVRRSLCRLGFCGIGIGAGVLLFVIPLWLMGALPDFYNQSFGEMLEFTLSRSGPSEWGVLGMIGQLLFCLFLAPLDVAGDLFHNYMWVLMPVCTLFLTLATAVRLARHKGDEAQVKRDRAVLIYSLFATASWHQYYPVFCQRHWYWAAMPCILPTVLLARFIVDRILARPKLANNPSKHRRAKALTLAMLILFASPVGYRLFFGIPKLVGMKDMVRYESEEHPELNGLYLAPEVALHFDTMYADTDLFKELFPEHNIVNLTSNHFYDLLGENFFHLYEDEVESYYLSEDEITADYIEKYRPAVLTKEPPREDYVLWRRAVGNPNDVWAWHHSLPADIYLPIELYEALPAEYK